jgi:hypothetical protein
VTCSGHVPGAAPTLALSKNPANHMSVECGGVRITEVRRSGVERSAVQQSEVEWSGVRRGAVPWGGVKWLWVAAPGRRRVPFPKSSAI